MLACDPAGGRQPLALCCTDPDACPLQVLAWYLGRWNVAVTFEWLRAWLGAETGSPRTGIGWCLLTTRRSTGYPLEVLFGPFSIVAGYPRADVAHAVHAGRLPARGAAWYAKGEPTFVDALAAVRRALWAAPNSRTRYAPTHPCMHGQHPAVRKGSSFRS